MRICTYFLAALLLTLISSAGAQNKLAKAQKLVTLCGKTSERSHCDSALKLMENYPMGNQEAHLIAGNAHLYLFKLEQEAALAPAFAKIGEAQFTPNRGYQFIGQGATERLRNRAQAALNEFKKVKKDNEAKTAIRELEDEMDQMNLQW